MMPKHADAALICGDQLAELCNEGKGGIYLNVHAQPGARRAQLRGLHGDAVKIAIGEAAQDGKANKAITRVIAKALDLPLSDVEITSGMTSRRKRVFLRGSSAELKQQILAWLNRDG